MKLIMIYDQIQSGMGTKDDAMLPLGAVRDVVGPAVMMEQYLRAIDAKVIATLYCGNGTYKTDSDEVARKLVAMCKKLGADFVMCGPAYNYAEYAEMCARVAADINADGEIKALAAMSEENAETIEAYRSLTPIVRTPKKGGLGLNDALKNMTLVAKAMVDDEEMTDLKEKACF